MSYSEAANVLRIVNVTSTTTATSLKKLIDDALAAKDPAVAALPDKELIELALTPSASLAVSDKSTGDEMAIAARTVFPIKYTSDIVLKNAATVNVELYFGD